MKLNITNLVFIFLLCIMTLQVNAQNNCGDDSKISTNPDDPINEREDPGPYSKLNRDMFDWRLEYYPIYCNSPYHQGYDFILSPLWDNDAKYNFIYKEFRPEDGWELIKEKRGYVSETDRGDEKKLAPDAFLWVVLYNRYSSILRVFVSVKQYEDYTGSKLSLSFVDEPANLKTNLLREPNKAKPLVPLDHFYDYQKLVSVSYYDNNPNRWLYADFQMVYDPCTCFYQSELNIDVDLIEKAQVDITGKIEGKLFDILSNNQGSGIEEDRGKKSFGIDDVGSVSKKAYQTFKSINSFSSDVQKSLDGTKRQEAEDISGEDLSNLNESELDDYIYDYIQLENTNYTDMLKMKNRISEQKTSVDKLAGKLAEWDFLRDALKAAPFIGSAVTVLDYFVGGGQKKNAQTVRLSPTGIDAVINLDGTIKIDAPYDNIKINTPGCDNSNLIYANTPIYDQVLGTFNLLKTPVIEYYNKRRLDVWTEPPVLVQDDLRYMLHNDIEYVANPAAGFNMEEIEILASFIFEFDHQFIGYQPLTENLDNLIIQEDLSTFRTQYVPLECLSEVRAMFVSDYYYYMGNDYAPFYFQTPVPDVYLKLLVNFTRNDVDNNTQNVLFVGRYPVETYIITEHAGWDEKWQSDYLNIPNDVVLENETISESISAWNTITIGENVTFNPNGNLIVEAGKQIILNGEYSIVDNLPANSSVIFELGVKAGCTNPRINPVTGQNLADFCSSNIEGNYKPDSRYFSFINNDSPKYNRIIIYPIYPNPVSSRLFVRYYLPADSYIQMKIINKLGLSVGDYLSDEYQLSGENQLEYDVSGLTSGIYYLVITHENQKITKQFVVIK